MSVETKSTPVAAVKLTTTTKSVTKHVYGFYFSKALWNFLNRTGNTIGGKILTQNGNKLSIGAGADLTTIQIPPNHTDAYIPIIGQNAEFIQHQKLLRAIQSSFDEAKKLYDTEVNALVPRSEKITPRAEISDMGTHLTQTTEENAAFFISKKAWQYVNSLPGSKFVNQEIRLFCIQSHPEITSRGFYVSEKDCGKIIDLDSASWKHNRKYFVEHINEFKDLFAALSKVDMVDADALDFSDMITFDSA